MTDPGTDEDLRLSRLFEALANPVLRHLLELTALAPRSLGEFQYHFDLADEHVKRAISMLEEIGLVTIGAKSTLHIDETGLKNIQRWLDRIASIRSEALTRPTDS